MSDIKRKTRANQNNENGYNYRNTRADCSSSGGDCKTRPQLQQQPHYQNTNVSSNCYYNDNEKASNTEPKNQFHCQHEPSFSTTGDPKINEKLELEKIYDTSKYLLYGGGRTLNYDDIQFYTKYGHPKHKGNLNLSSKESSGDNGVNQGASQNVSIYNDSKESFKGINQNFPNPSNVPRETLNKIRNNGNHSMQGHIHNRNHSDHFRQPEENSNKYYNKFAKTSSNDNVESERVHNRDSVNSILKYLGRDHDSGNSLLDPLYINTAMDPDYQSSFQSLQSIMDKYDGDGYGKGEGRRNNSSKIGVNPSKIYKDKENNNNNCSDNYLTPPPPHTTYNEHFNRHRNGSRRNNRCQRGRHYGVDLLRKYRENELNGGGESSRCSLPISYGLDHLHEINKKTDRPHPADADVQKYLMPFHTSETHASYKNPQEIVTKMRNQQDKEKDEEVRVSGSPPPHNPNPSHSPRSRIPIIPPIPPLSESQASYQNPYERRKLPLGYPDKNTLNSVRYHSTPSGSEPLQERTTFTFTPEEESSRVNQTNFSLPPKPPSSSKSPSQSMPVNPTRNYGLTNDSHTTATQTNNTSQQSNTNITGTGSGQRSSVHRDSLAKLFHHHRLNMDGRSQSQIQRGDSQQILQSNSNDHDFNRGDANFTYDDDLRLTSNLQLHPESKSKQNTSNSSKIDLNYHTRNDGDHYNVEKDYDLDNCRRFSSKTSLLPHGHCDSDGPHNNCNLSSRYGLRNRNRRNPHLPPRPPVKMKHELDPVSSYMSMSYVPSDDEDSPSQQLRMTACKINPRFKYHPYQLKTKTKVTDTTSASARASASNIRWSVGKYPSSKSYNNTVNSNNHSFRQTEIWRGAGSKITTPKMKPRHSMFNRIRREVKLRKNGLQNTESTNNAKYQDLDQEKPRFSTAITKPWQLRTMRHRKEQFSRRSNDSNINNDFKNDVRSRNRSESRSQRDQEGPTKLSVPLKTLLYCTKGIVNIPSPSDALPDCNSFSRPGDLTSFRKKPRNRRALAGSYAVNDSRCKFFVNMEGFLDQDIYLFMDNSRRKLFVEGRRPKRGEINARQLVETIDLPNGVEPNNLRIARDYRGTLYFEEAWIF